MDFSFITSNRFKSWKGNLLATGLASEKLYRCVVEGNKITSEEIILSNSGRVRNVVQAPDGSIYVSVENRAGSFSLRQNGSSML
jgi:glucose/arabinose dehydrogenase